MARKTPLEMAVQTNVKIVRTAIRLKHSIDADYEINARVSDLRERLSHDAQFGKLPAYGTKELLEIAGVIDGAVSDDAQ